MSPASQEKRLRVQGPRSSTGCRTCQQRHLKCDENRPECNRCLKSGKRCVPREQGATRPSFVLYTISKSPPHFPRVNAFVQRSLHHYRVEVAPAITFPFYSELWSEVVFQMTEKYPFIMSAVTALSNMYELYQQPHSARASLQQASIHHYNQAISGIMSISQNQDQDNTEAIVVSSVIFYALDAMRGSWSNALRHALSGMNIIEEFQMSDRSKKEPKLSKIMSILRREFAMFSYQTLEMGGLKNTKSYHSLRTFECPMPTKFTTAEDAFYHYQTLQNKVMNLMLRFKNPSRKGGLQDVIQSEEGQRAFTIHAAAVQDFIQAFTPLQVELMSNRIQDKPKRRAVAYMKMLHDITIAAYSADHELLNRSTFDALEAFFVSNNADHEFVRNKFALYMMHLPIILKYATQGSLEEQKNALALLKSGVITRREGVWTSRDAARIAERVLDLKQKMPGCSIDVLEVDLFDSCRVRYLVRDIEGGKEKIFDDAVDLKSYPLSLGCGIG
ncbi:hypothetical protein DM02DRAFT_671049 [Periconia macrospinosa]|uniref:Zn(2)-C6 fungal-type domain-containing protein n=1 Tax=Periconia macrospinosa TaxID=97972 RepID=A0A2V1DTU1_9PLEO|nr:hypothetical protein DM02DRAFT_671049 [Periconia macrospinosa]